MKIQINSGKMTNVNMRVKNIIYVKEIMFEILLHLIVKLENIYHILWMIQRLFVMKLQMRMKRRTQKLSQSRSCLYLMLFDKISSKTVITISLQK